MAVIDLPFDGILGSLAAGDCDVVGSAVSITDERKEQVDFSDPYFDSAQSLLIKAEDGGEITSLEDFDGRPLGVQSGTTGETFANENADRGHRDVVRGQRRALRGPGGGRDRRHPPGPAGERVPEHAGRLLVMIEEFPTDEQYGFAVAKDNTAVLDFLNTGLDKLRDDGGFDEIYATYFGEAEA